MTVASRDKPGSGVRRIVIRLLFLGLGLAFGLGLVVGVVRFNDHLAQWSRERLPNPVWSCGTVTQDRFNGQEDDCQDVRPGWLEGPGFGLVLWIATSAVTTLVCLSFVRDPPLDSNRDARYRNQGTPPTQPQG